VTLSSSSDMIAVLVSGEILGGGCYLFLMQEEEYEKCHRREAQAQAAAPPVVGANRSKSQLEMDLSVPKSWQHPSRASESPGCRASELPTVSSSKLLSTPAPSISPDGHLTQSRHDDDQNVFRSYSSPVGLDAARSASRRQSQSCQVSRRADCQPDPRSEIASHSQAQGSRTCMCLFCLTAWKTMIPYICSRRAGAGSRSYNFIERIMS